LPPKRLFQSSSERTTTSWPESSSAGPRRRPTIGVDLITPKNSPVTEKESREIGSPPPVMAATPPAPMAMLENTVFWAFQS